MEGADIEFKEHTIDLIEPWIDKELILDFGSIVEIDHGD